MSALRCILAGFLAAAFVASAMGQEKQPAAAQAQDLEPAVNTSAPPQVPAPQSPRQATSAAPTKPAAAPATAGQAKPKSGAKDRIDLDTTQITGNRELPKVLYIVPWKRSDLSDLAGRPANSLLDEVLTPVDRDVFKRENRYYGALNPDEQRHDGGASAPERAAPRETGAAAAPAARDEK